ncbi:hypothetical protein AMS68_006258 [Peltaster fructicola]|uniref:DUF7908 domain-containing protein n=1 Tax=Peltaster fructicola TaxID=286661 RepID=A0A6H0Y1E2_9PEZI|nr:hypothetical protein AMS68_006258 [Peltaster fructicola]
MLAVNAIAALSLLATTARAQQIYTITEYPSTCSAIYTSGTQSVTVVQSTVTTTVSPTPFGDAAANSGTPFVLQVGQAAVGNTRRQASTTWLMPNGNTTTDGTLAAQFYINNGQLRLVTGGYYSTSPGVTSQPFAASTKLSSINSTFTVFTGQLHWDNQAFTADGGALFYETPAGAVTNAQVIVSFLSDGSTTPASWSPVRLTARGVLNAVQQASQSSIVSVITSFIMSGMASSPNTLPSSPASMPAFPVSSAVTISASIVSSSVTVAPPISMSGIVPYSSISSSGTLMSISFQSLTTVTAPTGMPIGPHQPIQESANASSISVSSSGQLLPTLPLSTILPLLSSPGLLSSNVDIATSIPMLSSSVPLSSSSVYSTSSASSETASNSQSIPSTSINQQFPSTTTPLVLTVPSSISNSNLPMSTSTQITGGTSSTTITSSLSTASSSLTSSSAPTSTSYTPSTYACPAVDGTVVIDPWGTPYVIGCGQDTTYGNYDTKAVSDNWNSCFVMCHNSSTVQGVGQCTAFTYLGAENGDGPGTCFLKSQADVSFTGSGPDLVGAIQLAYYSAATSDSSSAVVSSSLASTTMSTTTTTMTTTSTTTSTTQAIITTTSAASSTISSSTISSSSSSSSQYLVLASPTPCNFGDPAGTDEDDSFCEIDLPFSMTMYSVTSPQTYASTNGYISMSNGSSQYQANPLPFSGIPNTTVCPLFDDLYLRGNASPTQGIFYQISSTGVTYEYYIGTVNSTTAIAHFTVGYSTTTPGVFTYTYYNIENGGNGATSVIGSQGCE